MARRAQLLCLGLLWSAAALPAGEVRRAPVGPRGLRERAGKLIQQREGWLLSGEIQRIARAAQEQELLAKAIARAPRQVVLKRKRRGGITARLPGADELKLRNVGHQLENALRRYGKARQADHFVKLTTEGDRAALLKAYDAFCRAEDDVGRRDVIEQLPAETRAVVELALAPQKPAAADTEALRQIAAEARAAARAAEPGNQADVFHLLSLAVDIDRVLQGKGALEADVRELGRLARERLPAEEAEWKLCEAAAPHFQAQRYRLAAMIYEQAYRPQPPLRASTLYAGMRLVRCHWLQGRLESKRPAEQVAAWAILRQMKDHLIADVRLEPEYRFVASDIYLHEAEYLELEVPYLRVLVDHGSTRERREAAATTLATLYRWAKRYADAASACEDAAKLVREPTLRDTWLVEARELRAKAEARATERVRP